MKKYIIPVIILITAMLTMAKSPELTSAKIYLKQDQIEKAKQQMDLAVEAQTGESEVYFLLGEYWAHKNDFAKMNAMFNKAAEINDRYYRKKGKKKIDERRKNWWIEFYNGGVRCMQAQEWSTAIDSLKLSTVIIPDSTISLQQMANCYINLSQTDTEHQVEDLKAAVEAFGKVTAVHPADIDSWVTMSQIEFQIGEYETALADARKALELDPNQVDAVKVAAFSLVNLKRQTEAIEFYNKALIRTT